ncbi:hypothetical protein TTHERM_00531880 (macronuclear) [Tetrahymena thermophila SB210]|uniref:EF-hand domain-containing protein n=1 Tax=Tetrahymena thermophila (strain SB210) TaxID=312017 RepID=Q248H7_TETTS|nr:hypothetical protein TTHERM_00531880 [Tetrahymena thermophila SB210]EAS04068.3 hypothetical protein TTHERM_00531880 [Tetrahymena thermophila SB210]|eukprot:XP_001024313.3 hypothetical protein TTHERM_00531880 [Tetrahymena thermophila SB210]
MEKVLELAKKLENTQYQEQSEWIADYFQYFGQEEYLQQNEEAQKLIKEIEEKLQFLSEQSRFGFQYFSSYFKGNQSDQSNTNKEIIAKNIKQLCYIIIQNKTESSLTLKQKQILIQEYFSLHIQINQVSIPHELKLQKIKETYCFKTKQANEFYSKYLQEYISKHGNSQKIFWTDFKPILEKFLKDQFNYKNKNDCNFNDLTAYLKQFIDKKQDNTIDFEEIDDFFLQYLNKDSFSVDDLYQIVENKIYKPINTNLKLSLLKYPSVYSGFYKQNGIQFQIKPYYDRISLGRKADKQNTIQIFPEDDASMSRQQFQIYKNEMQNYFIENLHQNIQMKIRVNDIKQIVRKGFTYVFPKKNNVLIEDIIPSNENVHEGVNQINPQLDQYQIELKANISQIESEKAEDQEGEIHFKYNNIRYPCKIQKFTIGKSLSDDIQIDSAEEDQQIIFEYIKNYGWVVYEPKPTKKGTFVKFNYKDVTKNQELKLQKNDLDNNQVLNSQQVNPKFQIFNGMQFQLADYECRLNFEN